MRALAALALAAACASAPAADLMQAYRDAKAYDAQYAAARHALEAGREKLVQGRALLLPTVGLSASATSTRVEGYFRNSGLSPALRDVHGYGYALNFSQPIYRPQNLAARDQAEFQVRQAEAAFAQAGQDLLLRVAQAYFDVLAAEDSLALVRAQKAAIAEQLEQAKRNFEVGTATITDTHEAQARFDLAAAQEIAAQNDLQTKRRALAQLTGRDYPALRPLRPDVKLSRPNPDDIDRWAELAERQSLAVLIQEAAREIAALEAERQRAGHLPTLDLVASWGRSSQSGTATVLTGPSLSSVTTTGQIGLQFALPLYQGGAISSRAREAAAAYEKAKQDYEAARRQAALGARQLYLAVASGIAQVAALEQALVSSQTALESSKLGYEVGVRINIDVLNAQQQVFATRRDLALARYGTITNHLRLKASVGALSEQDLEEVNRALAP